MWGLYNRRPHLTKQKRRKSRQLIRIPVRITYTGDPLFFPDSLFLFPSFSHLFLFVHAGMQHAFCGEKRGRGFNEPSPSTVHKRLIMPYSQRLGVQVEGETCHHKKKNKKTKS